MMTTTIVTSVHVCPCRIVLTLMKNHINTPRKIATERIRSAGGTIHGLLHVQCYALLLLINRVDEVML